MTDLNISTGGTAPRLPFVQTTSFSGGADLVRGTSIFLAVLLDAVAVAAAAVIADWYRFGGGGFAENPKLVYIAFPVYLLTAWATGGYRLALLRLPTASVQRAILCLAIAATLSLAAAFTFKATATFSRLETLSFLGAATIALAAARLTIASLLARRSRQLDPKVVLLGDEALFAAKVSGVADVINVRARKWQPAENDPDFLCGLAATLEEADRIVLCFDREDDRRRWARVMRHCGLEAEVLDPNLSDLDPVGIGWFGKVPTLVVSRGPLTLGERTLKRTLDLVLVLLAIPIVVPVVLLLALLVRLDSPGPAFFVQKRVGIHNRQYYCFKLRTMCSDRCDASGEQSTGRNDPRTTRLGSLLRRTSLDELPQLWNVLRGEMSLVGPRPHALGSRADGELFWDVVPGYWRRHSMKPGLTGLAQVRGYRGSTERQEDIINRVNSDLEYICSWSIWLDLRIMVRTISVLLHRNAF